MPSQDRLKSGDALILSFGAQVGGYNVECSAVLCRQANGLRKAAVDAMLLPMMWGENMKVGRSPRCGKKGLDQIRKAGSRSF